MDATDEETDATIVTVLNALKHPLMQRALVRSIGLMATMVLARRPFANRLQICSAIVLMMKP